MIWRYCLKVGGGPVISRKENDKTHFRRGGERTVLKEMLSGLISDLPLDDFLIMPLSISSAFSGLPALVAMLRSVLNVIISGALSVTPYRGGVIVVRSSPRDAIPPKSLAGLGLS